MLSLVLAGGGSFVVLLVSRWGRAVLLVGVFSGVFGRGRAWHVIGVLGQRAVWCGFLFPFLVGPAGLFWLLVGGWGLGVGGLVVNCIVGASIGAPPCPLVCCWGVWGRASCFCLVFDSVCFVVFACFYGRSVDALASGADEGRGGLR